MEQTISAGENQPGNQGGLSPVLVEHARNPRNMEIPENYNGFGLNDGYCGDMMCMWVLVEEGMLKCATFNTDGCGPSIACGSMATEMARGKTLEEAGELTPDKIIHALGGLPEDHVHCASLAAATLQLAIADYLHPAD